MRGRCIEKDLFVAIRGVNVDGHDFINNAIEKGAIVIVHEKKLDKMVEGVAYVKVTNSSKALAIMASNYYDHPSNNLQLIGVTGTNGKTTVSTLLYDLFISAGYKVGLISTVSIMVDNKRFNTTHTTPNTTTTVDTTAIAVVMSQTIWFLFFRNPRALTRPWFCSNYVS